MASTFIFLLFFTVPLSFHLNSALNQEGLYLLRVKDSLSDPAGSLSHWSDRDATPCNWTGITCDHLNSVVSVNLDSASLSGPFPMFLCRLPSLSRLSLSNNSINSSLPVSIWSCRNLTYLDLSENLFVGTLPYSLADIRSLR